MNGAVIVFLFGFFVLGILAYRTYVAQPPIPAQVVAPDGSILFTGQDVTEGQRIFLQSGLMEYGSIFGHGAYLGPDYTADYLRRSAEIAGAILPGQSASEKAARIIGDFKSNRFDPATDVLAYTPGQATAFKELERYYFDSFNDPKSKTGLAPGTLSDSKSIHRLTAFFSWSAWVSAARRPSKEYSYTNNFPPEPLVGNKLTADMIVWSVLSLIALLGGIGILLAAFGRWDFLGWRGQEEHVLAFRSPDQVALTKSQRACAWFFLAMSLMFLAQTLVGGATQHYRADLSGFFGFDLAKYLPFNITRTWHLQLSILWVSTSYLACGIFIAPLVARHEPKHQHALAYLLLIALAIIAVGSTVGEFVGIHGWTRNIWFGNQGFEYLDLGRFWQVLLSLGLCAWALLLFRTLRIRLKTEHIGNLPWVFFFSALAIPAFYAVGLLAHPNSTPTVNDFWRFWVVHLWVEDFLELFTTVIVAYLFVLLGIVREAVALKLIYLDIILYSVGGVIGTMHHVYFSGEPVEHMALGAFFSAAEVIPLTFLTLEAWSFLRLGLHQHSKTGRPFPHRWAVMFLVAVGFWNFLGAGIFGFLINLPIVSYYEIGTALTANHAHAAMMGVYGMLAVGLALFGLRYLIPERYWPENAARVSFWSLNIGLGWMVLVTLFPVGILQLYESVNHGYFEARQLKFITESGHIFEWLRLPGDALFILGGTLPLVYICWLAVIHKKPTTESTELLELTDHLPSAG